MTRANEELTTMELVLVLMVFAIVLGITPPLDRSKPVDEVWPDTSFE